MPTILTSPGHGQPVGPAGPGLEKNRELGASGGLYTRWEVLFTLTLPLGPGGVGVTTLGDDHSARLFPAGFCLFWMFGAVQPPQQRPDLAQRAAVGTAGVPKRTLRGALG